MHTVTFVTEEKKLRGGLGIFQLFTSYKKMAIEMVDFSSSLFGQNKSFSYVIFTKKHFY
jgi:hypothetical protein